MPVSPEEHVAAIEAGASSPEAAELDRLVEAARQGAVKIGQVMFGVEIPLNTPVAATQFVKDEWARAGWIVEYQGAWRGGEGAYLHFSKPPTPAS